MLQALALAIGLVMFFAAAGAAIAALDSSDTSREMPRDKKVRLAIYAVLVHVGLTIIGLTTPEAHWALLALLVANIGFGVTYLGLIRFVMRLNDKGDDLMIAGTWAAAEPILLGLLLDLGIFGVGIANLLAALYI